MPSGLDQDLVSVGAKALTDSFTHETFEHVISHIKVYTIAHMQLSTTRSLHPVSATENSHSPMRLRLYLSPIIDNPT